MQSQIRSRYIAYVLAPLLSSGFAPAFAQEATPLPLSENADTPPPYFIVATESGSGGEKALSEAKWQWTGWTNDQKNLGFILYSGTFSTNCIAQPLQQDWRITISRDGIPFWIQTGNRWENPDLSQRCGLSRTLSKGSLYEVLTPGVYEFRLSWPMFGADLVASFTLPPCGNTANLPVYSARHEAYTDNFYTVSPSELNSAVSSYGYTSTGVGFRNSQSNEKTAPWKRFFKGAPQIEHFYTHLGDEEQSIYPYGYVYESTEGHVFPAQVTGTVPLYRVTRYDGATGGLEHAYTTSSAQVSTYQSQGWTSDGVKGYTCPA